MFKIGGRKRIKDRGIKWEPTYHERSKRLKERFDKKLGQLNALRYILSKVPYPDKNEEIIKPYKTKVYEV